MLAAANTPPAPYALIIAINSVHVKKVNGSLRHKAQLMYQLYREGQWFIRRLRGTSKALIIKRTKICGFLPKQATVTMSFIYSKIYSSCQSDTPFKQTELGK